MNKNSILRKYAAIAALAVSAIVFLPETLFAQGTVIGYAPGYRVASNNLASFPTDAQLDRLTHLKNLYLSVCN